MVSISIYDAENIDRCPWPDTKEGEYARKFLTPLMKNGPDRYIDNIKCRLAVIVVDDIALPVSINETEYENSYVCSPYSHYISYSIEEADKLDKGGIISLAIGPFRAFLRLAGLLFQKAMINKAAQVNNWLVSTNLYPSISRKQIKAITDLLTDRYKDHAVIFKSLNAKTTESQHKALLNSGYVMVFSRMVNIFDTLDQSSLTKSQRRTLRRDKDLDKTGNYQWEKPRSLSDEEIDRITDLYNQLYINKYSPLNPQFNSNFVKLAVERNILDLALLRKEGVIYGVLGYFIRDGTLTTPLLGYDMSVPQEDGLYRRLSRKILDEAEEKKAILNRSSGVSDFKQNRGAVPVPEYGAVYFKHLSFARKLPWLMLKAVGNTLGAWLIEKYKL